MPASFVLDPSLRIQTVVPPADTSDTFDEIPPLAVGAIVSGIDDASDFVVNWDLDDDGEYDDLLQTEVGIQTVLSQEQIDVLGWNQSGTHKVSALVSGGSEGDHVINDTIVINSAPIPTSGFQNYLYAGGTAITFADADGDALTFSNISVSSGLIVSVRETAVVVDHPHIVYIDPNLWDDEFWDPWADGSYGSISFTVSDGKSSYTHQEFWELRPDIRRGPDSPGVFSMTDENDDYTAPNGIGWSLFGMGGDDKLTGNTGQDSLYGGVGNDILAGAGGDDMISGGVGKDTLTGGSGMDRFVFAVGDSRAGGGLRDLITDFKSGEDKLDLSALNITDFDAQVSFKAIGSGLIVYADLNGNGFDYSDFGVQLKGVAALDQGDFLL